ncbi:PilW family protein [Ralstonia flatus]|uniref:PilW family protein n=1 Tax=Ralstonia flatus TaxID=3058601 RepID=UPI00292F9E82|nr:PilW family protein [Ralstonia sp. LMG 32965]
MSLIELLVGMVIALMVLGIALQLILLARAHYWRMADDALIQDRGMEAIEFVGKVIRQAGWSTDTPVVASVRRWPGANAPSSLLGQDNCGRPHMTPTFNCDRRAEAASDALLVRFSGRGAKNGDGAMRDCLGYGVPERQATHGDPRLGGLMLYVTHSGTANVPQLVCRAFQRNVDAPVDGSSDAVVRGVETLQLLYTVGSDTTSPATIKSARSMQDEDWFRVRLVHVGIVVQGDHLAVQAPTADTISLFPDLAAVPDALAEDLQFRPADPRRNRAHFAATFAVRNPLRCEADAC